jgi:hypothetical protein
MAILTTGNTFADGDQVTSTKLNDIANAATFASGAVDDSTTQLSSGAIIVKDLGISTGKIAASAVTTAKINASAVTTAKIADSNVTKAKIEDFTNLTVLGNVSGSAATPAEVTILDEDNMASNSATSLATQQSIKAYVDTQLTAEDLDFAGDTGTGSVDLDSQTFTIAGATGLDTTASSQTLTVSLDLNELATESTIAQDDFVIMVEASDDVNFDSGTLFVDASTNCVGIGTTSAIDTQIGGNAKLGAYDASGARIGIWGNGGRWWYLHGEDSNALQIGYRASGNTTDGDAITILTGPSVGIGTTSPGQKLEVNGGNIEIDSTGAVDSRMIFSRGGTNLAWMGIPNWDEDGLYIYGPDAGGTTTDQVFSYTQDTLKLKTNGSDALTIDSSQKVGIGTTSPGATLDVSGEFRVNGGGTGSIVVNDEDSSLCPTMTFLRNGGGTTTNDFIKFENSGGEVAAINATGGGYFSGDVGIGTSSPEDKLDVVGNIRISANKTASTNKTGRLRFEHYDTAEQPVTGMFMNAFSSTNELNIGGGTSIENATTAINFYTAGSNTTTSGTERMTINASGNVGIGTTAPSNTLHVENTTSSGAYINYDGRSNGEFGLRIESNADGGNFESDFAAGGTALLDLYANSATVSGGDLLVARTQSATPVLLVKGNGNIGIGETSPDVLLHVGTGSIYQNKTGTGTFPGLSDTTSHGCMIESQGPNGSSIHVSRVNSVAGNFSRQGTGDVLVFRNTSGSVTEAGSVEITGASSVAYRTSSDYRLKENVVDVTDGIDRVKQLNPVRFNFIGEDPIVDGFLAHEVQDIVPEAISGTKDGMKEEEYIAYPPVYDNVVHPAVEAVYEDVVHPATYEEVVHPAVEATYDEDGNELTPAQEEWTEQVLLTEEYTEQVLVTEAQEEWTERVLVSEAVMDTRSVPDYQGIDQSKLVPLLTAALQEAVAKIEALEARVQTLEG